MDETFELRPQRRRSSILPRRSVAPPLIPVVEDHANDSKAIEANLGELKTPSCFEETVNVDHLKSHLTSLTTEHVAWKSFRTERKLMKTSADRILAPPQLSWESAQEFLSDEDLSLLKNLPSYDNIYASYDDLIERAAQLRVKYRRTSNLALSIQRLAQRRLHSIKVKIGEYSENNLDLPILTQKS